MHHNALLVALLFFVLTFAVDGHATQSGADSGAFLYQACQVRLKTIDEPQFKPTSREAGYALMCDSYVQGFTDGMIGSSHEFCAQTVTREQTIRKYVAFMTENPLFLKEDKLMAVALVLQPIYRCSKR